MSSRDNGNSLSTCSFITEQDDSLKCLICLEVAEDPWQHGKCGRLFCRECLDEYGMDRPCPACGGGRPCYHKGKRSELVAKLDLETRTGNCPGKANHSYGQYGAAGDIGTGRWGLGLGQGVGL